MIAVASLSLSLFSFRLTDPLSASLESGIVCRPNLATEHHGETRDLSQQPLRGRLAEDDHRDFDRAPVIIDAFLTPHRNVLLIYF